MRIIEAEIQGVRLTLETDDRVFSPSHIDAGTLAMLSRMDWRTDDKVLDLGCGCGVVGILAAKKLGADQVLLCDSSPAAVEISKRNAERNGVPTLRIISSDGFSSIEDRDFTAILSNPPYHADFSVPKHFIEKGWRHLAQGGRMLMVTKRLEWYKRKLATVFGGVSIREIDGYYVFLSEKRIFIKEPKQ